MLAEWVGPKQVVFGCVRVCRAWQRGMQGPWLSAACAQLALDRPLFPPAPLAVRDLLQTLEAGCAGVAGSGAHLLRLPRLPGSPGCRVLVGPEGVARFAADWTRGYVALPQHRSYVDAYLQRLTSGSDLQEMFAFAIEATMRGVQLHQVLTEKLLDTTNTTETARAFRLAVQHHGQCASPGAAPCDSVDCAQSVRRNLLCAHQASCAHCGSPARLGLRMLQAAFPLMVIPEDPGCEWVFCGLDCAWRWMLPRALRNAQGHLLLPCVHAASARGPVQSLLIPVLHIGDSAKRPLCPPLLDVPHVFDAGSIDGPWREQGPLSVEPRLHTRRLYACCGVDCRRPTWVAVDAALFGDLPRPPAPRPTPAASSSPPPSRAHNKPGSCVLL